MNGRADRPGAVRKDRNVDTGGNPLLELRQEGFDPIDGVDNVGVRLLRDNQQHCRLIVEPRGRARVTRGANDFGDVADA